MSLSSSASSAKSTVAGSSMSKGGAARVMASRIPDTPISLANQITIRLTADNYLYWRTQVDPILRSNLLYGFVDGTLVCPPEEIEVPASEGAATSTKENPKYAAWHQQDQAILSALVSSLTEGVIGMVMMAPTSQEAWETLEASFASQSTARVMQIRTALSKIKKHDYPQRLRLLQQGQILSGCAYVDRAATTSGGVQRFSPRRPGQ